MGSGARAPSATARLAGSHLRLNATTGVRYHTPPSSRCLAESQGPRKEQEKLLFSLEELLHTRRALLQVKMRLDVLTSCAAKPFAKDLVCCQATEP